MSQNYFSDCGNYAERLQEILKKRLEIKSKNEKQDTPINPDFEAEKVSKFFKKLRNMTKNVPNSGKLISEAIAQFEKNVEGGQTFEQSTSGVISFVSKKEEVKNADIKFSKNESVQFINFEENNRKEINNDLVLFDGFIRMFDEKDRNEFENRVKDENDSLENTIFKKVLLDANVYLYAAEESENNFSKEKTLEHILRLSLQDSRVHNKMAFKLAKKFDINEAIVSHKKSEKIADIQTILALYNKETGQNYSLEEYKEKLFTDKNMIFHYKNKTYEGKNSLGDLGERSKERFYIEKIRKCASESVKTNDNSELIEYAKIYPDLVVEVVNKYKYELEEYEKNNDEIPDELIHKIRELDVSLQKAQAYLEDKGISFDEQQKIRTETVLATVKSNMKKVSENSKKRDIKSFVISKIVKLQYEEDKACSEYALELAKQYGLDEFIEKNENNEKVVGIEKALDLLNKKNHTNISYKDYMEARENAIINLIFYKDASEILKNNKKEIEAKMKGNEIEDSMADVRFKKTLSDAFYYRYTTEMSDENYSKAETIKHIMNLVFEDEKGYSKLAFEMAKEYNIDEVIVSDENGERIADMDTLLDSFNKETGENLSYNDYKKMRLNDESIKRHYQLKTYESYGTIDEILKRVKERKIIDQIRSYTDIAVKEGNNEKLVESAIKYPDQFRNTLDDIFIQQNENVSDDLLIKKVICMDEALRKARQIEEKDGYNLDEERNLRATIVLAEIRKNTERVENSANNPDTMKRMVLSKIIKLQYEENKECSKYALDLAKKYKINELIEKNGNEERVVDFEQALEVLNKKNNSNISIEKYSEAREKAVGRILFFKKVNKMLEKGEENKDKIKEELQANPQEAKLFVEMQVAKLNKEIMTDEYSVLQESKGKIELLTDIMKDVKETKNDKSKETIKVVQVPIESNTPKRNDDEGLEL